MRDLARHYGIEGRDDGFVVPRPGGRVEIRSDGVFLCDYAGVGRRVVWAGRWLVEDQPLNGTLLPGPSESERMLQGVANQPDPVHALTLAMAHDWLEGHAAHLLEASELDLGSVQAPLPVVMVPLTWIACTVTVALLSYESLAPLVGALGVLAVAALFTSPVWGLLFTIERSHTLRVTAHQIESERSGVLWSEEWGVPTADVAHVRARGKGVRFTTRTGEVHDLHLKGRSRATAQALAIVLDERLKHVEPGSREDVPEALRKHRAARVRE